MAAFSVTLLRLKTTQDWTMKKSFVQFRQIAHLGRTGPNGVSALQKMSIGVWDCTIAPVVVSWVTKNFSTGKSWTRWNLRISTDISALQWFVELIGFSTDGADWPMGALTRAKKRNVTTDCAVNIKCHFVLTYNYTFYSDNVYTDTSVGDRSDSTGFGNFVGMYRYYSTVSK